MKKSVEDKCFFESETKTSQLFLNENNIILINFHITVRYAIVLILTHEGKNKTLKCFQLLSNTFFL